MAPVSAYQEMRIRQEFGLLQPVGVSDDLIRAAAVRIANLFRPRIQRRRKKG